jgi:hypothetical protein
MNNKVRNLISLFNTSLRIIKNFTPVLNIPIEIYLALSDYSKQIYQKQINEYIEFIVNHKDEFVLEIIETPKFKNLFVQLIRKLLDETYDEKRKLILNYILNLGKGININFDSHTKAIRILELILPEEVATLFLWENELKEYKSYKRPSDEFLKKRGEFMNIRYIQKLLNEKNLNITEGDMYFIIKQLNSYGLLGVKEETPTTWDGGKTDLTIVGITKFGEDFLNFIK